MSKPFCRYPGGKSRHTYCILRYFKGTEGYEYRELFVGAGSVYLESNYSKSWINDLDEGIADMWCLVKENPDYIIRLLTEHTKILEHNKEHGKIKQAIDLWKEVRDDKEGRKWRQGYRSIFLNKTCFSGVQNGGPTGGMHQTGKYTLTSRWSLEQTIDRIRSANKKLQSCKISQLDWSEVATSKGDRVVFYADPPYLLKGDQCYRLSFTIRDHEKLAKIMMETGHRFLVTVDDCPEMRRIWFDAGCSEKQMFAETWLYSMSDFREENRSGKELFIVDELTYSIAKEENFFGRNKVNKDLFPDE